MWWDAWARGAVFSCYLFFFNAPRTLLFYIRLESGRMDINVCYATDFSGKNGFARQVLPSSYFSSLRSMDLFVQQSQGNKHTVLDFRVELGTLAGLAHIVMRCRQVSNEQWAQRNGVVSALITITSTRKTYEHHTWTHRKSKMEKNKDRIRTTKIFSHCARPM